MQRSDVPSAATGDQVGIGMRLNGTLTVSVCLCACVPVEVALVAKLGVVPELGRVVAVRLLARCHFS